MKTVSPLYTPLPEGGASGHRPDRTTQIAFYVFMGLMIVALLYFIGLSFTL